MSARCPQDVVEIIKVAHYNVKSSVGIKKTVIYPKLDYYENLLGFLYGADEEVEKVPGQRGEAAAHVR